MLDIFQQRRNERRNLGYTDTELDREETKDRICIFLYAATASGIVTLTSVLLLFWGATSCAWRCIEVIMWWVVLRTRTM